MRRDEDRERSGSSLRAEGGQSTDGNEFAESLFTESDVDVDRDAGSCQQVDHDRVQRIRDQDSFNLHHNTMPMITRTRTGGDED